MGKTKRRFNWKARQLQKTEIDDSESSKIKVEIDTKTHSNFDASNPLVIPSVKRKTRVKKDAGSITRILSRKQKKRLEKIVDKKKKKENREVLLQSLSEVQAEPEMLSELTSIASVQTKGRKQHFSELENGAVPSSKIRRITSPSGNAKPINSIAGSKARLALLKEGVDSNRSDQESDPNIVGLEESSEGSDSDDESGEDTEEQVEEESNNDGSQMETEENAASDVQDDSELLAESTSQSLSTVSTPAKQEEPVKGMAPKIPKAQPKPVVFVAVDRRPDIQAARLKLPVLAEEQTVMEAISGNSVVIIAGETGSGKTTQIPQFLYEAGYASGGRLIGVTEPRRVAAISMSKRVAEEMNLSAKVVSYLIRFEGNVTETTSIKFMTDGVLLKEIQHDFLLTKYSVIVLDEAHERSVYTDILIGLLSRIVPLRVKRGNPLKLIIMSATLRLEDFTENPKLFRVTPPVIKIETRQFPVTIHFNKRTNPDYCTEAYKKACKIHAQLPEGGILIFLTGQQEVKTLICKLRKAFPFKSKNIEKKCVKSRQRPQGNGRKDESASESNDEMDLDINTALKKVKKGLKKKQLDTVLPEINLDKYSVMPNDDTAADLLGEDDDDLALDDDELEEAGVPGGTTSQPLWVLPLYSILPTHEQAKVFEPPPTGCRLCVVATNVAETSLTIPNVKYVVDCGKWKSRVYDKVTGISSFNVEWCSKASANQRAGRAGRTGPGHCYRIYSSAVFNDSFPTYTIPEIQRKPVDDLVLQMKSMSIHKVVNFPFPSAPDLMQIKAAERRLRLLGALAPLPAGQDDDFNGKLTPLGQAISAFPVAPRFGKMLALSHQHDLLAFTVCLVAALSVQEVLFEVPIGGAEGNTSNSSRQLWSQTRRKWAGLGNSKLLGDPMVLLRAVGAAEYAACRGDLVKFCSNNGLRHKAVVEIRKLRLQLTNEVNLNVPHLNLCVDPSMEPPSDLQAKLLRQVMLSGLVDQVARKVDAEQIKEVEDKRKWKHAYQIPDMEDPVFMHSSSILRKDLPEYVVYQEIYETNKMYMRGVTAVEPEWLPVFAPARCNISEPIVDPPPRYDAETERLLCHVSCTFGRSGWPLPVMELDFPPGLDRYKWFASFLLDGSVFPKLAQFVKILLSNPSTMVKTWAKLQPRTDIFLKSLVSEQVDSTSKLRELWKKDPKYLLEAYKKWIPESAHLKVSSVWPPV